MEQENKQEKRDSMSIFYKNQKIRFTIFLFRDIMDKN